MKLRNLLIIGIFLVVILQIAIVLGEENENIKIQGDIISSTNEDGTTGYMFTRKSDFDGETFIEINGNKFGGILPYGGASGSATPSYIFTNTKGEIIKLDLYVNENGGIYTINGEEFKVSGNSRITYDGKKFELKENYLNQDILKDNQAKNYEINGNIFSVPVNSKLIYDPKNGFQLSEGTEIKDIKNPTLINGKRLKLFGETSLDFEGYMVKTQNGFLIEKGKLNYKQIDIQIDGISGDLLIADPNVNLGSYKGNWIKQSQSKLEMKSSENGFINAKFLENHTILNTKKGDLFDIKITNGDGLVIEKQPSLDYPKIVHKSSANGNTLIRNGGIDFDLDNESLFVDSRNLKIEDILEQRYGGVGVSISSDSENIQEKVEINSGGIAQLFDKDSNLMAEYENVNLKKVLDFEKYLGTENLNKIASSIKENVNEKYVDIVFSDVVRSIDSLSEFKQSDFSPEQMTSLFTELIETSREESGPTISNSFIALKQMSSYNISNDQITDFILTTTKKLKDSDGHLGNFDIVSDYLLPEALKYNLEMKTTENFIDEIIKSKSFNEISLYPESVKEYNGENFNEIKQGIKILSKYRVSKNLIKGLDISVLKTQTKQDFAKEYASAINQYIENNKNPDIQLIYEFGTGINNFHDSEGQSERTDEIREIITKDLSFKSRYYLVAKDEGDLYPSTFEKIYGGFPEDLSEQINQIDPEGKDLATFTLQMAKRNKLPEILNKHPNFFINSVKKSFESSDEKKLFENSVAMTNTIKTYYENPEFSEEKKEFENFFFQKYKDAKTDEEKANYAYFLKLNKNPINEKIKKESELLPSIVPTGLPSRFKDLNEIKAKLYYMDDEEWFGTSKEEFSKTYGMQVVKSKENEIVLSKNIGDKKITIVLQRLHKPEDYAEPVSDLNIEEELESDEYVLLSTRTHCYNVDSILKKNIISNSEKIIFMGQCWGTKDIPRVQSQMPNTHIIADSDSGEGKVNNQATYELLVNIAKGKLNWNELEPSWAEKKGFIYPDDESMLLRRYINNFSKKSSS